MGVNSGTGGFASGWADLPPDYTAYERATEARYPWDSDRPAQPMANDDAAPRSHRRRGGRHRRRRDEGAS